MREKLRTFLTKWNNEDLIVLNELIESGKITPVIDTTLPLSEAAEAIRYLEAGHAGGENRDHGMSCSALGEPCPFGRQSRRAVRPLKLRRAAQSRTPLSRERVLGAAINLADNDGIDALSMRKLGQELGVEAMSLYNHVRNKEDILDGRWMSSSARSICLPAELTGSRPCVRGRSQPGGFSCGTRGQSA